MKIKQETIKKGEKGCGVFFVVFLKCNKETVKKGDRGCGV